MDKDLVRRWINDLRYGGHEQARGYLHIGEGYCCLGRAIEVMYGEDVWQLGGGILLDKSIVYGYQMPGETVYRETQLSLGDILRLGLEEILMKLVEMNDSGKSFKEIADYIEAELFPEG
jgi:hypothetical protein